MTERLETVLAAERLLSAVKTTVLGQVMFVLERLVTDGTDERPLTYRQTNHTLSQLSYLTPLCISHRRDQPSVKSNTSYMHYSTHCKAHAFICQPITFCSTTHQPFI